jgi:hypothetical protein
MLVALGLVLAVQEVRVQVGKQSDAQRIRDSVRAEAIARGRYRGEENDRRPPRRIPVTPELERTAFIDAGARSILTRARDARMRQDSSLLAYDANAYQRLSVGLGFRAFGRNRLLFRTENATRVRWTRDGGTWIDLKGRRSVFSSISEADMDGDEFEEPDFTPIPYFPGRDALWIGADNGLARAEVDDREMVHPIAIGSEAYYRFASGDSLTFTLSDGKVIQLRELRVVPRHPEWKLSVGSFWFDVASGQLVRAAYRFSVPLDIWAVAAEESRRARAGDSTASDMREADEEVPAWVKGMLSPMQANLEAVTIEYGLYGERFWLPRSQSAEGWGRAGFFRVPFEIQESFKYASVNGTDTIPAIPRAPASIRDSLFGHDSTRWRDLPYEERRRRMRMVMEVDSTRREQRRIAQEEECRTSGYRTNRERRAEGSIVVAVRIPCDTTALATSPELPKSIYDPGDEVFSMQDRDDLLKALDFGLQPGWAPQRPILTYGLAHTRYNRVEGLSTGLGVTQQLGAGYTADLSARIGIADWEPNAELGIARSNGRTTWRLAGYRRLAVANDWGSPLSFGASLGAALYGRDEGFYYRSAGLELERFSTRGSGLHLRVFGEHHSDAPRETDFSVFGSLEAATALRDNIDASNANVAGAAVRHLGSLGLDPLGWRLFTDLKLEGGYVDGDATGEPFGRAAFEATVTRGLGKRVAAAVSGGAGIAENAPVQRLFFIGGSGSVRGQVAGQAIGDAFWFGRAELGLSNTGFRPVVFGDIGWAGPRALWQHPGRPLSGVGVGASIMDGLIRFDVSRGIYAKERTRVDLYLEAKF